MANRLLNLKLDGFRKFTDIYSSSLDGMGIKLLKLGPKSCVIRYFLTEPKYLEGSNESLGCLIWPPMMEASLAPRSLVDRWRRM